MSKTRFYVEMPADKWGNVSKPLAVYEARIVQGGPDVWPMTNPARPAMLVSAPAEIAATYRPGWYTDHYNGWKEVGGPARILTREEWTALVAGPGHITCGELDEEATS